MKFIFIQELAQGASFLIQRSIQNFESYRGEISGHNALVDLIWRVNYSSLATRRVELSQNAIHEQLQQRLGAFLGENTARVAIATFAKKSVNKTPEQLMPADVPAVLDAIAPMLRTLLGEESAKSLLESIRKGVLD